MLGKTRRDIARAKTILAEKKGPQWRRPRPTNRAAPPRTPHLVGKVVSDKRAKTITVLVERREQARAVRQDRRALEQVPRARREGNVQPRRRGRDLPKAADLSRQVWVVTRLVEKARPSERAARAISVPYHDATAGTLGHWRPAVFHAGDQDDMIKVGDQARGTCRSSSRSRAMAAHRFNTFDISKGLRRQRSRSSRCPAPSRRPAPPSTCRYGYVEKADELKAPASTRSGASRSTTPSSWAPGAATRRRQGKVRMMADGSADFIRPPA